MRGIPVRGTLGIVITAKLRGVIPAARPVLEQLRQCGGLSRDTRKIGHVVNKCYTTYFLDLPTCPYLA